MFPGECQRNKALITTYSNLINKHIFKGLATDNSCFVFYNYTNVNT